VIGLAIKPDKSKGASMKRKEWHMKRSWRKRRHGCKVSRERLAAQREREAAIDRANTCEVQLVDGILAHRASPFANFERVC